MPSNGIGTVSIRGKINPGSSIYTDRSGRAKGKDGIARPDHCVARGGWQGPQLWVFLTLAWILPGCKHLYVGIIRYSVTESLRPCSSCLGSLPRCGMAGAHGSSAFDFAGSCPPLPMAAMPFAGPTSCAQAKEVEGRNLRQMGCGFRN